jgi:OOP family OmpA-OmpF porin
MAAVAALALLGCAGGRDIIPYEARLARPGEGEVVAAQDNVIIVDASGSIDRKAVFPQQRAIFEAYVEGMPPGTYRVEVVILGARAGDQRPLEKFDRYEIRDLAYGMKWSGRETPLARVLREQAEIHRGGTQKLVYVIFTDGVPTRYGKYIGPEETLEAAQQLRAAHDGELCFHTIQVGADTRGVALLAELAEMSGCGSFRTLDALADADALYAFQQQIYIGPAPPPAPPRARAITDLDEDGVDDRFDRCAKTPRGAVVDTRGCWVIEDYVFALNAATILAQHTVALERVVSVLEDNPSLRIRLDGHTDVTGAAQFNFDLGERRAHAVAGFLRDGGVSGDRLEVRSFGPTRPIASNDTPEGRRRNRRVEISVIDF